MVEVVSPGSESADRDVKPAQYAKAGIPHYWRIETRPDIVVHTFRLAPGPTYVQTGAFGRGSIVAAPGLERARIDVSALVDRVVNEE